MYFEKKKGLQMLDKIFKVEGLVILWLACWMSGRSTRLHQNCWVVLLNEIFHGLLVLFSPRSKGV